MPFGMSKLILCIRRDSVSRQRIFHRDSGNSRAGSLGASRSPAARAPGAPQSAGTVLAAYTQAQVMNQHAVEATGGKTHAELERRDRVRETAIQPSFLLALLFTLVVAYGVALSVNPLRWRAERLRGGS